MTGLYPHSAAIPAHVRITMRRTRTMIALMTAQIIMDVHSSHVSASECQCPSQAGLGFHAVLPLLSGDGFPFGLSRFPPRSASCPETHDFSSCYALFVASCVIIAFKLYDPMRKTMGEFGTSPAAHRTGGEAGALFLLGVRRR